MSHLPLSITNILNQTGQVCCFQILDAVFPNDLFSDYLGYFGKRPLISRQLAKFQKRLRNHFRGLLMKGTTARSVQWPIPISFQGGAS